MVIKGTLANFNFKALNDLTIDERRAIRKELPTLKHPQSPDKQFIISKLLPNLISDQELTTIGKGFEGVKGFKETFNELLTDIKYDADRYEKMNVQRLNNTIDEVPEALAFNFNEIKQLKDNQDQFVQKILAIIANINSSTDVQALGRAGFLLLCKIANTDSLHIEPEKKINEAHQLHMKERNTEFCKGYIYKWTKDEEFANKSFSEILGNFTEHQRTIYQKLADSIEKVNSAVQTAYECNWKQIKMIKTVYSILQEVMAKNFPQL